MPSTPPFAGRRAAHPRCARGAAALLLGAAAGLAPGLARAQAQPQAPAAAAPAAAASAPPARPATSAPQRAAPSPGQRPQQVEITGTATPESNEERRRSTASRITYGREELDRMGDASLGEVLKRLPGVTLGGPPGRGGQVRMRGMGGGYTQILIDGQRMAPGFSLDSIPPEQIEKIEIMRAPVAEYGARAIAGTINVVMRADFKRKTNELRVGGGADGSRPSAGIGWTGNGNTERLGWNLAINGFRGGQDTESDTTNRELDASGTTTRLQQVHASTRGMRTGLFTNGRLQLRFGPGEALDLQPFVNLVRTRGNGHTVLLQPIGSDQPFADSTGRRESEWAMARLNGTYTTATASGGRLLLRFGGRMSRSTSLNSLTQTGGSIVGTRLRLEDSSERDSALDTNGKFSQLLGESHSMSAGWELERTRRSDRATVTLNGVVDPIESGDAVQARVQRLALYAQDEWEWSKAFSFYVGARWEGIETRSDAVAQRGAVRNRSQVFTPLAHMVWKIPDAPRDQVRLSLTRSYRSPNLDQLVARPRYSTLYPDLSQPNTATSPDRIGNPALKPELAWSLELGYEHYLDAGGVLSANVYWKRIDELIRSVRSEQTVPWASVPRWVAQPVNLGQADAAGLELEAKARLADLWAGTPEALQGLSLRSNASLMWSRVAQVPGPDNRLEGQPPWTANLGADWVLKGLPLTLGASLNYTPSFRVQEIDDRASRQGAKVVVDFNALWRFSPEASLRLTLSNADPRTLASGSTTTLADGSSVIGDTRTRTYTNINLRGEFRF